MFENIFQVKDVHSDSVTWKETVLGKRERGRRHISLAFY